MRFSMPCGMDGQGAWDAELDMTDSYNYMTEEMVEKKMVKDVRMEIHGFRFLVDFFMIGYANKGEPSVIFGRD
ncbi:hypothetical protein Tco_0584664, partial [Tanacetum coccineum]